MPESSCRADNVGSSVRETLPFQPGCGSATMMDIMRRGVRTWGRVAAAAVLVACAVWSTIAIRAAQDAPRVPPRPAGWNAATHGENGRPDYQRLFGMDTV